MKRKSKSSSHLNAPNRGLYCKKHDKWFMNYLNHCPICAGEELGKVKPVKYVTKNGEIVEIKITELKFKRKSKTKFKRRRG